MIFHRHKIFLSKPCLFVALQLQITTQLVGIAVQVMRKYNDRIYGCFAKKPMNDLEI